MQQENIVLNDIFKSQGREAVSSAFVETAAKSRFQASRLINDKDLSFTTLYMLMPEIQPRLRYLRLSQERRLIIGLLRQMKGDVNGNIRIAALSRKNQATRDALIWAVSTGYLYDGDDDYDMVMDSFICVLLKSYKLKEALPYAEKLIFDRYREGKNIHDLVWAYFSLHDPSALRSMAKHLKSESNDEAELARELLDTGHVCKNCKDAGDEYEQFNDWLQENDPYLYFTDENLLYSNMPMPYKVDRDRKYLQKGFKGYERRTAKALDNKDKAFLKEFKSCKSDDRERLCRCSHELHRESPDKWKKWIRSPLKQQLSELNSDMEGKV